MKSFDQLVDQPTHLEGGILDHLYIRKVTNVKTLLHHPYCTDHDCVLALLQIDQVNFKDSFFMERQNINLFYCLFFFTFQMEKLIVSF